jgi:hypothetical protein
MKVWKDIISGDEMVSDSYPHTLTYEDAILEVKSRLVSKNKNDNFGIACKQSPNRISFTLMLP